MGKTKSTSDHLLGSVLNTILFGAAVGALGAAIAFFAAPVVVWPVIAWAGLQAALSGALTYGCVSLGAHALRERIPISFLILSMVGTIASAIFAGFSLIPGGNKKIDFPGLVQDTLTSTANARFGNDWELAEKGLVVNINVPVGKTTVPMVATVSDKQQNLTTGGQRDGGTVYVSTCVSFDAATEKTVQRPFNGNIQICQNRYLTQPEVKRFLKGP